MKKIGIFRNFSTASLSLGVGLHLEVIRAPVKYIVNEKFSVENSSISTKNFESTAKNRPPISSNLKIWAFYMPHVVEQGLFLFKQGSNSRRVLEKK